MSRPVWHRGGARLAEVVLWTGASLAVLAAHVGAAAWLMREEPIVMADDAPPAAIMIELADIAEALDTAMDEITPDLEDADASMPAEMVEARDEPEPETEPELVEEADVVPDEAEPVEEEIVEEEIDRLEREIAERLDNVVVPIPVARPDPPPVRRQEVRREQPRRTEQRPQPQQQQTPSPTTRQARAQVQESSRTAAAQTSSGVSAMSPARWQSRLMAHLERRKRYPSAARSRREEGTVHVRFTIDDNGNVLSVSLAGSSGSTELDNEVLSLVQRASPVPAPPPGVNRTITAPVRFSLR